MRRGVFVHCMTRAMAAVLILSFILTGPLTRGEYMALHCMDQLGKRYKLGERGPDKYDCSGLMKDCFSRIGVELPHSAEEIGTTVPGLVLKNPNFFLVGDVICFDTVRDKDPSDHCGLWIGGNRFIHASSGQHEVIISELEGYYAEHFTFAKRLICPYF